MRLANENFLEETVEIDETLVGGRNGNRHWDKKVPHSRTLPQGQSTCRWNDTTGKSDECTGNT